MSTEKYILKVPYFHKAKIVQMQDSCWETPRGSQKEAGFGLYLDRKRRLGVPRVRSVRERGGHVSLSSLSLYKSSSLGGARRHSSAASQTPAPRLQ